MKKENIDTQRIEQRFMVPQKEAAAFLKQLERIFLPVSYPNNINQTIYFNNDDLAVPWGISIKARRYLDPTDCAKRIDPTENFFCEIKKEKKAGSPNREKIKTVSSLSDFSRWAKEKVSDAIGGRSLYPHILTQYRRRHFILPRQNDIRVTTDSEMAYGFFTKDLLTWLGEEEGLRVEIKTSQTASTNPTCAKLFKLLKQHGAVPVISKKDQAYNLLSQYLDKFGDQLTKELAKTEIEAKFLVECSQPYNFFLGLRNSFLKNKIPGFTLKPYPYIKAGASINFYWTRLEKGKPVDGIKLLYKGQRFRIVTKAKTRILKDIYGLNCLMIRREEKGERFEHSKENLERVLAESTQKFGSLTPQGHLLRSRLAIWPESEKTRRVFHLSLDRCSRNGNIFYQLEIEYVGRKPGYSLVESKIAQEQIIKELSLLSHEVFQLANKKGFVLQPSQLTKLEWIRE